MAEPILEGGAPDRCANPDCRVAEDGRCVEGFTNKTECPQFGKVQIVPAPSSSDYQPDKRGVPLQAATTMSVEEADEALKRKESRVIAIAGPPAAGKTSLIGGLYDLFQLGKVGEVAFCKSFSLHAFEEATHHSRAESRRDLPDTTRTPRGEVRFYHLELVDKVSRAAPTVLLGDRAGEEYLETRSSPDLAKAFPELRRADVLTMLIDGERLLDDSQRFNVRSEIRQTVQAFVEAGVVRPSQRLAVVLTKLDVVQKAKEDGPRALKDFDWMVSSLRTSFGLAFAAVEPFSIAAQPKSDGAERGTGLDQLLTYWMAEPTRYQPSSVNVDVPAAMRHFERLPMPRVGAVR